MSDTEKASVTTIKEGSNEDHFQEEQLREETVIEAQLWEEFITKTRVYFS